MDPMWANLTRLTIATCLLGIISSLAGRGLQLGNEAFGWYFVSGMVGFGLGDIGLYLAFARLGARLTMLINLCLAPLFAAAGERLLLGTQIHSMECLAMIVVIAGVGLSITGKPAVMPNRERDYPTGLALAVLAGFGQGAGAVLSRWADLHAGPDAVTPFAQAFQRCSAGCLVLLVGTLIWYTRQRKHGHNPVGFPQRSKSLFGRRYRRNCHFGFDHRYRCRGICADAFCGPCRNVRC